MTNSDSKTQPTHDEIAARAYQLWEADGRRANRDQEYWYQAIAHLAAKNDGGGTARRETAPAASTPTPTPAQTATPTNGSKTEGPKKRKNENQGKRQPAFA